MTTGKEFTSGYILFFILFFINTSLFPDITYYQSNDIGMKLKKIQSEDISAYEYVLAIAGFEFLEERKLYSENELIKRWEFSLYNNTTVREERVYGKEHIESLRYYDRRGRLIEEHLYSNEGLFTQKTTYFYKENQELFQTKTFDSNGDLLYIENYEFNRLGMLRKVRREWNDGRIQVASFIYGKSRLVEEVYSADEKMTVSRYDEKGNLKNVEVWKNNDVIQKTTYTYSKEDGVLEAALETNFSNNINTERKYNKEGRLSEEIITKGIKMISKNIYFYDEEGRKTKMNRVSDKGLEQWAFYYDSEGELNREEYFQRGVLEKRTVYTDDNSYYEELFRYGELLIRVFYQDEEKIKEEFIKNGEVVKVKTLENEE